MRKSILLLVAALFFAVFFVACDKDDDSDKDKLTIYKAELKGSSEVPSNTSEATGTTFLTFNEDAKTFTAVTTYMGLTPAGGHIHMAAEGANGAVVYPFGTNLTSPISFQSGVLTVEQIKALEDEMLYVNLHTEAYPGGEIRGQLIKQ